MEHAARSFVSHAPADSTWCRAFVQALCEAGADVWEDEHPLGDGVSGEQSARELPARPLFLVILSSAALAALGVHRAVRAARGVRETAWPGSRSMLVVLAEQVEVPRVWADAPRVRGPGDRGLAAPEAARRHSLPWPVLLRTQQERLPSRPAATRLFPRALRRWWRA